MKDPADAYTLELPLLGVVALPDWLRPAVGRCPREGAEFGARLDDLQDLPRDATTFAFMRAYDRMLEARERLYDAWLELELDAEGDDASDAWLVPEPADPEDPVDLELELERTDDAEDDSA